MIWQVYVTIIVLAGAATWTYMIRQESIAPMSMVATALWAILAAQARNIVVVDGGVSVIDSAPSFQWIAVGMAVLSFGAFILWYFGEFPPQDEDMLDDEGQPTTGGV